MDDTRIGLLVSEMLKCSQYTDDVATWDEGLSYLEWWEQNGHILHNREPAA
jgi:hypothetical protein